MEDRQACNEPMKAPLQATSPADFLTDGTKVVTLPTSGKNVRISKVSPMDLLGTGQLFMSVKTGIEDVDKNEAAKKPAGAGFKSQIKDQLSDMSMKDMSNYYSEIICVGVVEPKVVSGDWDSVDWSTTVHVRVFGNDVMWLGGEIMAFSGLGELAEKAAPFSEESDVGSDDSHDGTEVQYPTDGVTEIAGI